MRIDIGCGSSKRPGFFGVDIRPCAGVDVVHDCNSFPYPFADETVTEAVLDNVLEHLREPIRVMEEVHRICAPGAPVTVSVPFFRSAYACIDPTHRHFFGSQWFSYFDPAHPFCDRYGYSPARFRVERIAFDRERREAGTLGPFRRLIVALAERKPFWYEHRVSHLYPLDSITFHLTVIKGPVQ